MNEFYRFPHTPHIAWLGKDAPRDDKILTPAEAAGFLDGKVIIEEKIDGANLGFSIGPDGAIQAQMRGQYLPTPFAGQFSKLGPWLLEREDEFFDALGEGLILFGEWCEARHSLAYDLLPDWFLVFDVYERRSGRFWNAEARNEFSRNLGLCPVRRIAEGRFSLSEIIELVCERSSSYRDGPLEGLYLRKDEGSCLARRAKIVRPEFTQAIGVHWSARNIERNVLLTNNTCHRPV